MFYQLITNDLLIWFLCYYYCQLFINHLPISLILFTTLPILLLQWLIILICCKNVSLIITNLTQSFTLQVYQWLPINCQYIITNHSIGNFLPSGSRCFINHQFTNTGTVLHNKLVNSQLTPIFGLYPPIFIM